MRNRLRNGCYPCKFVEQIDTSQFRQNCSNRWNQSSGGHHLGICNCGRFGFLIHTHFRTLVVTTSVCHIHGLAFLVLEECPRLRASPQPKQASHDPSQPVNLAPTLFRFRCQPLSPLHHVLHTAGVQPAWSNQLPMHRPNCLERNLPQQWLPENIALRHAVSQSGLVGPSLDSPA